MKLNLIYSVLAIALLSTISACKDDDETPITGITFESEEQEVTESDGTLASFHPEVETTGVGRIITAKLTFERALAGDVVLKFDIDGEARETTSGDDLNDFEVVAENENVTIDGTNMTILKGATEAVFSIRVFEDYSFEAGQDFPTTEEGIPYEDVEITLESVVSGPAKLGEGDTHTFKILEDDSYVYLEWNPADQEGTVGDVNMDLFLSFNGVPTLLGNTSSATQEFEAILIAGGEPNATLGMSYVYKAGTSNDLKFISQIANYGGTLTTTAGETGVILTSPGSYTIDNKNDYVLGPNLDIEIEQTMVKNGLNYTSVTEINEPATSSRLTSKSSKISNTRFSNDVRNKLSGAKATYLKAR
jgi:hypothetical protein